MTLRTFGTSSTTASCTRRLWKDSARKTKKVDKNETNQSSTMPCNLQSPKPAPTASGPSKQDSLGSYEAATTYFESGRRPSIASYPSRSQPCLEQWTRPPGDPAGVGMVLAALLSRGVRPRDVLLEGIQRAKTKPRFTRSLVASINVFTFPSISSSTEIPVERSG